MIINPVKQFLFIHIQKTAGTSITSHLLGIPSSTRFHHPHTLLRQVELTGQQHDYYKFAFVRNPWDRLYSWYCMIQRSAPSNLFYAYVKARAPQFRDFLDLTDVIEDFIPEGSDSNCPNLKSIAYNQIDYLTDAQGGIKADFIGRFERLETDYQALCSRLGLPFSGLGHLNRHTEGDYRKAYRDEDVEKVRRLYCRDIEHFGYDF